MYEFALLAFGGLVVALAVRLIASYGRELARANKVILWLAMGVGFAYLVDFSIFAAWDVAVRSTDIGAVITGFIVGGMAMLWEEVIAYFQHSPHSGSEKTLRRAA